MTQAGDNQLWRGPFRELERRLFEKADHGALQDAARVAAEAGSSAAQAVALAQNAGNLATLSNLLMVTSEIIAPNRLVNVWSDGGLFHVRNANATAAGREAHGFTPDGAASGAACTFVPFGILPGQSGLTPGMAYLSTSNGLATSTAPAVSGNVVQALGPAVAVDTIEFTLQPSKVVP